MELDKMDLEDESSKAYEDYETSEKFVGLQVWAYKSVIKFEQFILRLNPPTWKF